MIVDKIIKNGKIVCPYGIFRKGVAIDNGKIVAIAVDKLLLLANLPMQSLFEKFTASRKFITFP